MKITEIIDINPQKSVFERIAHLESELIEKYEIFYAEVRILSVNFSKAAINIYPRDTIDEYVQDLELAKNKFQSNHVTFAQTLTILNELLHYFEPN